MEAKIDLAGFLVALVEAQGIAVRIPASLSMVSAFLEETALMLVIRTEEAVAAAVQAPSELTHQARPGVMVAQVKTSLRSSVKVQARPEGAAEVVVEATAALAEPEEQVAALTATRAQMQELTRPPEVVAAI